MTGRRGILTCTIMWISGNPSSVKPSILGDCRRRCRPARCHHRNTYIFGSLGRSRYLPSTSSAKSHKAKRLPTWRIRYSYGVYLLVLPKARKECFGISDLPDPIDLSSTMTKGALPTGMVTMAMAMTTTLLGVKTDDAKCFCVQKSSIGMD